MKQACERQTNLEQKAQIAPRFREMILPSLSPHCIPVNPPQKPSLPVHAVCQRLNLHIHKRGSGSSSSHPENLSPRLFSRQRPKWHENKELNVCFHHPQVEETSSSSSQKPCPFNQCTQASNPHPPRWPWGNIWLLKIFFHSKTRFLTK